MSERQLLILELGSPRGYLPDELGDFVDWTLATLGPQPLPVRVIDALGPRLPAPAPGDVVITTGSVGSVYDREPWSERAGAWLKGAAEAGAAILGVCFGHQLLAQTFGGRVERNPNGMELGTAPVRRLVRDPLLEGLGECFDVHHVHYDAVMEPPPDAVVLASTEMTAVQSMAIGERVRTIQWHPEFPLEAVTGFIELFRSELEGVAPGETDRVLAAVHEPPDRGRILRNFLRNVAEVPL